jgi:hypothetical protein
MVSCLRSASVIADGSDVPVIAGSTARPDARSGASSAVPHCPQYRKPRGFSAPQEPHRPASGLPHSEQYRALDALSN